MSTPLNPFDKRPAPDGADAGGASAKRARVSDAVVEAGSSAPPPPPVGDAPSEHAEMFKLIHRFATQGVRTEGLTLRACMRDSGWSHLPRPFIKRVQVHNKWGYAVGVEWGRKYPGIQNAPEVETLAAVYFDKDYAVEQFCSLFHQHTPNTSHFFPTGQALQERVRAEGRGCWDLSWRECRSAGIVASCSGIKARSDEGNNRKVKRALDNEPVLITLLKSGKHVPRHAAPWDIQEPCWANRDGDPEDGEQEEDLFGDDDD